MMLLEAGKTFKLKDNLPSGMRESLIDFDTVIIKQQTIIFDNVWVDMVSYSGAHYSLLHSLFLEWYDEYLE